MAIPTCYNFERLSRISLLMLGVGSCLLILGCGHSDRVQVSGTVTYTDGSIPQGEMAMVRFEPAADSNALIRKGAYGYIQPDGSFLMQTMKPNDGVYPGKYKICFMVKKSYLNGESLVAPKYRSKKTTPFEETIEKNTTGLHFEIERNK